MRVGGLKMEGEWKALTKVAEMTTEGIKSGRSRKGHRVCLLYMAHMD